MNCAGCGRYLREGAMVTVIVVAGVEVARAHEGACAATVIEHLVVDHGLRWIDLDRAS